MAADNFLRGLPNDGLFLPEIKPHSLEKIQRHNSYARLFCTAMKKKWPQRAYVGLYSGAGRARIESTGEIVETTAMSVFRQDDRFTKYIFVDNDPQCVEALAERVAALPAKHDVDILQGDAADLAPIVRKALPAYGPGHGLLSFCFVDPFAANLQFDTIRQLSDLRMDFLILLMLGWDARVNFRRYFENSASTRIADLIDCPNWRSEWEHTRDKHVVRFLLKKFDEAMVRVGYLPARESHFHAVRATGLGVLQYVLTFYSKHKLGQHFWEQALELSTPQLGLDLA